MDPVPDVMQRVDGRVLFDLTPDPVAIVDGEGLIVEANPALIELADRPVEDLRRRPWLTLHPPAHAAFLRGLWQARSWTEGHRSQIVRPDGTAFTCELIGRSLSGDQVIILYRDVSARLRAEEDIHLRNVAIASVTSGVTIADARQDDIPLIYVNRGFEKLTGYSAKECVGRSCRFLQADDRDQPALELVRAALREGTSCNVRLRNYRKDGSLFWNDLHLSPVYNDTGDLTHFVGIQLDVTDRVLSRQQLEASERRYRHLADTVEDMITVSNADGIYEYVSPASAKVLGYAPQDLVGRGRWDIVHPEDRPGLDRALQALIHEGTGASIVYRSRRPDGTFHWLESTESRGDGLEGDPVRIVSVARDVTARMQAQEETRRALDRERELNEIKSRFIRMVSHEFRTPMTGLRASAEFLRSYGGGLAEDKRERHHRNIETALKRMNDMLDDVLFVSRAEAGKLPFNPRSTPLKEYCQALLEDLRLIHPDRDLRLGWQLPETFSPTVDRDLLTHILQNLLNNALKYSAAPTPVLLEVEREAGELRIAVVDQGIGIPLEDQPRLFEPFHRASNVGTARGTGLGLNIALRAAEIHGGSITFVSQPNQGTRFCLHLPLVEQPAL